jgi:hypothetical protein
MVELAENEERGVRKDECRARQRTLTAHGLRITATQEAIPGARVASLLFADAVILKLRHRRLARAGARTP